MGNDPINGVDPDGAFWQELGNWFKGNGWKSNDAVAFGNAHPDWTWNSKKNNFSAKFVDSNPLDQNIGAVGISPTFGPVKDFWQPLGNWYNGHWSGKFIPDVIYINQTSVLNYLGGGGYSTGYALQLKGKEGLHLYSTLTFNAKAGLHGAADVNVGYSSYTGDSRNFSFMESFAGEGTRGFDSDIIIGIGGTVSKPNAAGGLLYSYDIGAGPSIGASVNVGSITFVKKIW